MDLQHNTFHNDFPSTQNGEGPDLEHEASVLAVSRVTDLSPAQPLFTRPRLQEAFSELQRITPTEGGTYSLHNIENKLQTNEIYLRDVRLRDEVNWRLCLTFNPYNYIPQDLLEKLRDKMVDAENKQTLPFSISASRDRKHECWNPNDAETKKEMEQWEQYWATSAYRKGLITHLTQNTTSLQKVSKIVCFGLGPLPKQSGRKLARSYVQHLAAVTIRDTLSNSRDSELEIYAQDPAYCPTCVQILKDRFNITTVPGPHGFFLIDAHTFVMTVAPDVPIKQIATDITYDEGGPVALLCNIIKTPEEENRLDAKLPASEIGIRFTDPSSWRVVEYRDRCVMCEWEGDVDREETAFWKTALYIKN